MKSLFTKLLTGLPGAFIATKESVDQVAPIISEHDKETLIVTIVSVIGAIVSSLLTSAFSKLFKKKPK